MDRWEAADRIAQGLIDEMVELDRLQAHVLSLPTDHPEALAYAERLEDHRPRAIEFAQRIQNAINPTDN